MKTETTELLKRIVRLENTVKEHAWHIKNLHKVIGNLNQGKRK